MIWILLFLLTSFNCFGSAVFTGYSVTLYNSNAGSNVDSLLVEAKSGTSADPHLVYLPLADTDASESGSDALESYFNLLSINSGVDLPTKTQAVLGINVLNNGDETLFIHIAAEGSNGTTYYPSLSWITAVNNDEQRGHSVAAGSTVTLWLDLDNLCSSSTNCTSWSDSSNLAVSSGQKMLIFTHTSDLGSTSISDSSTYDGNGFYLEVKATSTTEDSDSGPTINNVFRGDTQIIVSVVDNGLDTMADGLYRTMVARFSTAETSNTTYRTFNSSKGTEFPNGLKYYLLDPREEGLLTVNDVTNGEEHYVGVAQMNKYYFLSWISPTNATAVTPAEIEAFLQAKSCFLLSAAFQKNHYVLEFFRALRDNVLMQHPLGILFVNLYYQLAPEYTQTIWHSRILQIVIKFSAFFLYAIIKFWNAILLGGLLLGVLNYFRLKSLSSQKMPR
jgi:hypothetical protein